MARHLAILVSPSGEELYDSYGPMTRLRDRATRFATAAVAAGAANHRFGRHSDAFWESERASRDRALAEHRGWSVRTEEVADDDERRQGHYVSSYAEGEAADHLYARTGEDGATSWSPDIAGCDLWPSHAGAMAFVRGLERREGRRYAVATY